MSQGAAYGAQPLGAPPVRCVLELSESDIVCGIAIIVATAISVPCVLGYPPNFRLKGSLGQLSRLSPSSVSEDLGSCRDILMVGKITWVGPVHQEAEAYKAILVRRPSPQYINDDDVGSESPYALLQEPLMFFFFTAYFGLLAPLVWLW